MPTFTVTDIQKVEDKPAEGNFGPQKVIWFTLEGNGQEPRQARWWATPNDVTPKPGESIDGEMEQKPYGWKFKRARSGGGRGFGGGGGRSPEENRRIVRQHSQDMAIQWAQLAHARGTLPESFDTNGLLKLVDVFHNDAMRAAEVAPK